VESTSTGSNALDVLPKVSNSLQSEEPMVLLRCDSAQGGYLSD